MSLHQGLISKFNPQRLGSLVSMGFFFASVLGAIRPTEGLSLLLPRQILDAGLLGFYGLGIGLLLTRAFRWGRHLIALVFLGYGALLFPHFLQVPSQVFLLVVALILALFFLFRLDREHFGLECSSRQFYLQLLTTLSLGQLFNWSYVFLVAKQVTANSLASLLLGLGLLLFFLARYRPQLGSREQQRIIWILGAAGLLSLALASTLLAFEPWLKALARSSVFLPLAALLAILPFREWRSRLHASLEAIFFHPEGAVLVTFFGLCAIGTLLLNLPVSAARPGGISWVDAAFTAVSAVCVTGLAILDTPHDFSLVGQVFILLLVQVGGLGIMALSAVALLFVGNRFSLRQETALLSVFGDRLKGEIGKLVKMILSLTLGLELVGVMILTVAFRKYDMSWGEAIWNGLFAAVSAFCNAGFFLHSQNLIPYNRDPLILNTVGLLIIMGGLSPAYIIALSRPRNCVAYSLQFRFITYATLGLLAVGTVMLLIIEWNHTLSTLPVLHKINNAWFQSIVTRTAGFNSVDITQMTAASHLLMIALMFIGGSPGGTAGGIKTTSFMVIIFTVISIAKGRSHVEAFSRRLPQETVLRATTVTIVGLSVAFFIFLALLLTQNMDPFILLFEVVSALGTVGLTAGATTQLNDVGKFLIMAAMFLGRVGPLSVFLFLGYHASKTGWSVPEEDVVVT